MECVGCTACIDACNDVMQHINLPKGLIRYASENEIKKKRKFKFNTRMKAYSVLLVLMILFMTTLVVTRKTIDTHILRAKGQLYQEMPNNIISNLFEANIINKTNQDVPIELKLSGTNGTLKLVGSNFILLKKEAVNNATFFIEIPKKVLQKRSTEINIDVYQNNIKIQTVSTKFLGPFI
jgi:polyferredoxin